MVSGLPIGESPLRLLLPVTPSSTEIPRPAPRVPPATTATLPSNGRPIEPPLTTSANHTVYNLKRLPYGVYLNKEVVSTWDERKVANTIGAGGREPGRRRCRATEFSTRRCSWGTRRGWGPLG